VRGRTWIAALLGATLGALIALAVLALAGTRIITSGVDATLLDAGNLRSRAEFVVSRGGFNLLVATAGLIGGAALGAIGSVVGREAGGDGRRLDVLPLTIIGAFVGLIAAYATATASLGAAASIDDGLITVSVFRAIGVALLAGGITGGVVGGTVERISHPEVLGLEGDAWPSNPVAFAREALTAVGFPALGAVVGIGLVYGLSTVLLEADHTLGLIVFGGVAAAVLAGAAFIAAHPPGDDDGE
jgi:hypothetical protein